MGRFIANFKDTKFSSDYLKAEIKFKKGFGTSLERTFNNANTLMAKDILESSEPYLPLDTGKLLDSGKVVTRGNEAELQYNVDYATYAYYKKGNKGTVRGKRGARWFERMWSDKKEKILTRTYKIVGRDL